MLCNTCAGDGRSVVKGLVPRGCRPGQNGACGSGPLLSVGPAPRPPFPSLAWVYLPSSVHSLARIPQASSGLCSGHTRGGEGRVLGPTEGQGLTLPQQGRQSQARRVARTEACPVERGAWEGGRAGPCCPTPALRCHTCPGCDDSLNAPVALPSCPWLAGCELWMLRSRVARGLTRRQDLGGLPSGASGRCARNFADGLSRSLLPPTSEEPWRNSGLRRRSPFPGPPASVLTCRTLMLTWFSLSPP